MLRIPPPRRASVLLAPDLHLIYRCKQNGLQASRPLAIIRRRDDLHSGERGGGEGEEGGEGEGEGGEGFERADISR